MKCPFCNQEVPAEDVEVVENRMMMIDRRVIRGLHTDRFMEQRLLKNKPIKDNKISK